MKACILYIFALSLLPTQRLFAQSADQPYKISVALGPSFPVGNFAKAGVDSFTKQSAAKTGLAATISFSYQIKHSDFGITITGGWEQHAVNGGAFAKALSTQYPGDWIFAGSDSWHIWKLMAGPVYTIRLKPNSKINFDVGVEAGIMNTTIPDSWQNEYGNYSSAYSEEDLKTKLASFCYQASAGMSYRLTKNLSVNANLVFFHGAPVTVSYLSSSTYYFYYGTTSVAVMTATETRIKQVFPMSTVETLVGINWQL